MATIAELLLKVDSSQLDSATTKLNKFSDASKKANAAASGTTKSQQSAEKATTALARKQEAFVNSLNKQIAALEGGKSGLLQYQAQMLGVDKTVSPLIDKIDRLAAAKNKENQAGKSSNKKSEISLREQNRRAIQAEVDGLERIIELEREKLRSQASGPVRRDGDVAPTVLGSSRPSADVIAAQNAAMRQTIGINKQLAASTNVAAKASNNQEMELEQLRAAIDPVSASIKRLQLQQQQLAKFRSLPGGLDEKEYQRLSGRLGETAKRLNTLGATTGKTAKEIAFSMRGLPAQFTDIAVSLQGGQAPLTVFLQQGGQLKDMFGGIRPALQAMGKYILGLVNPLTITVGLLATLGVAAYKGSNELNGINRQLILTGQYSEQTSMAMSSLADNISAATGSLRGGIIKGLEDIVATGKLSVREIEMFGRSILDFSKASGRDIGEVAEQFASLKDEPADAIRELDRQYKFLSSSTYAQITALQAQGKEQEASVIAMREFAKASDDMSKKLNENLGGLQKAWRGVAGAAKSAWDAMLDIGREQSLDERIAEAESKLAQTLLSSNRNRSRSMRSQLLRDLEEMYAERTNQAIDLEIASVEESAEARRKALIDVASDSSLIPDRTKLKNDITEAQKLLNEFYNDPVLRGNFDVELGLIRNREKAEKALAEFDKRSLGRVKKEAVVRESEAQKRLNSLKEQLGVLEAQRDGTDKLTKQAQDLIKFNQEIANIKNLKILTADQKSVLANESQLRLQLEKNASVAQEIVAKERLAKLDAQRAALQEQVIADQQRYAANLLGATTSDREADRLKEEVQLRDDLAKSLRELERERDQGSIDQSTYGASVANEVEAYNQRLEAQRKYNQESDALRADWTVGAQKSFANFIDAAGDTAGQTQALFDNALNGISDTLVDLVTTGKASFKDLASSILKEIAKIATNKAIASLLGSMSGSSNGIFSAIGSFFGQADGGAWNNGVQMFANGGSFTNSVVSRPTAFGAAGGLGVMGEAGPEAILPLTRTSDGKLGVQSTGGAGSTVVAPVSVVVNTDSGAGNTSPGQSDNNARAVQQAIKMEAEKAISNGLKPGGSIYRAMKNR